MDPKFAPLKEELEAELRIWEEAEVAEPTQASQMTNRRKSNARRSMAMLNQSLRNVSINRTNCESPMENATHVAQSGDNLNEEASKENDQSAANRSESLPKD